jgi:hypothetical protein
VAKNSIDHITVTAPTLASGADYIRQTLGVAMQPGGEHPRMGTHNLLLRLGDDMFLEVIAPNPDAPSPGRPRWFNLDKLRSDSVPVLATWVVRTGDIRTTHAAASEDLGKIEPQTRGALNWLLTIPEDGSIALDGVAPALIEWQTDTMPPSRLEHRGLSLAKFEIFHPDPERVSRLLGSIGIDEFAQVVRCAAETTPHLIAYIDTLNGRRKLAGHGIAL